jgi:threonine synthase
MSHLFRLHCPGCGREFAHEAVTLCPDCFYPTEIAYDYGAIRDQLIREAVEQRPRDIWRYRELLPVPESAPRLEGVGWTPLLRASRLGRQLGSGSLFIKDDAACFPTLSFKDRVVAVALAAARELGFTVVGCASTGNLANAVAAHAARAGLEAWVLVPADLEPAKLLGTAVYGANLVPVQAAYDRVNRLCAEIAERHRWGFVNVNLRPFYAEGSKTVAFEIAEQLGWRLPDNVVVPMAGGAQLTRIARGFQELVTLGMVADHPVRLFGAQARGCSPIATAHQQGREQVVPVVPDTICKSLAIGNPADGHAALRAIATSGGGAGSASDSEIVRGIRLLAETEGILGETAAGVTVAVTGQLLQAGAIAPGQTTVLCVTGNGLKTLDCLGREIDLATPLAPTIGAFESRYRSLAGAA